MFSGTKTQKRGHACWGALLVITGVLSGLRRRAAFVARQERSNFISLIIGASFSSSPPRKLAAQCFALLFVIGFVCLAAHARLRTFSVLARGLATAAIVFAFGMLGPIEWSGASSEVSDRVDGGTAGV